MATIHTGTTQIAPNSTGNVLDDVGITNGAVTQRRQVISLGDPDAASLDSIAAITNSDPVGSNAFALVTRPIDDSGRRMAERIFLEQQEASWNALFLNECYGASRGGYEVR